MLMPFLVLWFRSGPQPGGNRANAPMKFSKSCLVVRCRNKLQPFYPLKNTATTSYNHFPPNNWCRDAGTAVRQGAVKELRAMCKLIKNKKSTYSACFCLATMLASKIIPEIMEDLLNFLGARIAAINLIQLDLNKP